MAVIKFGSKRQARVASFSIQEDSTPIDPSDTTGGVSSVTIVQRSDDDTEFLEGETFVLSDKRHGEIAGVIDSLAIKGISATLTATSIAGRIIAKRQMPPYIGTLGGAIDTYLATVNIAQGQYQVDASLSSIPVTLPGWNDDVWLALKRLAVAYDFEISLIGEQLIFRPLRQRVAVQYRDSDVSFGISRDSMAQAVEGYYYSNKYQAGAAFYPPNGWNPDVTVYQVDAGAVVEFDIPVNASLTSIVQPTCVSFVGRYDTSASQYAICGNDGLPIPPTQWLSQGGSLVVSINDDQSSIHVRLTGATQTNLAPYRVAVAAGPSDVYSSLRLTGTGVFYNPQKISVPTGADPDRATQEVGATVQNPFFSSMSDLLDHLIWTVARYAAPRGSMTVSTRDINKRGDALTYSYPTIRAFNAVWTGKTVAQFDTAHSGMTIADFNAEQAALVAQNVENQLFGNMGGSRVMARDNYWRIRTATDNGSSISYTAEIDTTIGDFNDVWSGMTIADFDAQWYKRSIAKFNLKPLRRDS